MAFIPAFVSTGSSSRISTKPIDFSFSKWDGSIGSISSVPPGYLGGPNAGQLLPERQDHGTDRSRQAFQAPTPYRVADEFQARSVHFAPMKWRS